MSAISLHAQVQFHAKCPLFDNQSEPEFTFTFAILRYIGSQGSFPGKRSKSFWLIKRIFWFLKPDPNMITLTFYKRKGVYLGLGFQARKVYRTFEKRAPATILGCWFINNSCNVFETWRHETYLTLESFVISLANLIENAERQLGSASYETWIFASAPEWVWKNALPLTAKSWVTLRKSPCAAKCCDRPYVPF